MYHIYLMTNISEIAGGWPLWLLTLGPTLLDNEDIEVPFLNIFIALLMLVVPLGIGIGLAKMRSQSCKVYGENSSTNGRISHHFHHVIWNIRKYLRIGFPA